MMRILFSLAAAAALLVVACTKPEPLPDYSAVPAFQLTTQDGAVLALEDLRGQVWVADFVFTSCAGPCPLLSRNMGLLQSALEEQDLPVRLVSFSVDPERDSPEVLADYGRRFGADFRRWSFLTGDKQAIYDLIYDGFKLAIDDGAISEDGSPGPGIITHSVRFVLIDQRGRIRGYYSGERSAVVEEIIPAVRRLIAGG